MKHTPGPWKFTQFDEGVFDIVSDSYTLSHSVAEVHSENKADAQLIACAPTLLKALQLAHHLLFNSPSSASAEDRLAIESAIEEAGGEIGEAKGEQS